MCRIAIMTMSLQTRAPGWARCLGVALFVAVGPVFAADAPAPKSDPAAANRTASSDTIVSTTPMEIEAEGTGVHGQLVVAQEILSPDSRTDLVYTITTEPAYGRVGLASGGD